LIDAQPVEDKVAPANGNEPLTSGLGVRDRLKQPRQEVIEKDIDELEEEYIIPTS
jgi:hypothetical protein